MGIGMYLVAEFIERRTTGWATRGVDAVGAPRGWFVIGSIRLHICPSARAFRINPIGVRLQVPVRALAMALSKVRSLQLVLWTIPKWSASGGAKRKIRPVIEKVYDK